MPSNITRGNVEGLISVALNLVPTVVYLNSTTEQHFAVPGLLTTDIVINLSMYGYSSGVGIGNARVSSNGVLAVIFSNCTGTTKIPLATTYFLVVGRPSNASLLNVVSF